MQQLHIPNDKKVKGSMILAYCAFVQNSISLYCNLNNFLVVTVPDFITEWLLIQSVVTRTVKNFAPYSFCHFVNCLQRFFKVILCIL